MKKTIKVLGIAAVMLAMVFLMVACSNGSTDTNGTNGTNGGDPDYFGTWVCTNTGYTYTITCKITATTFVSTTLLSSGESLIDSRTIREWEPHTAEYYIPANYPEGYFLHFKPADGYNVQSEKILLSLDKKSLYIGGNIYIKQ